MTIKKIAIKKGPYINIIIFFLTLSFIPILFIILTIDANILCFISMLFFCLLIELFGLSIFLLKWHSFDMMTIYYSKDKISINERAYDNNIVGRKKYKDVEIKDITNINIDNNILNIVCKNRTIIVPIYNYNKNEVITMQKYLNNKISKKVVDE